MTFLGGLIPSYSDSEISGWVGSFSWGPDPSLADIIRTVVPLSFAAAGIILLVFILIGGFKLLTSGGNPKQAASGQKTLTNAGIGFLIVIVSFWLFQIIRTIFSLDTGGPPVGGTTCSAYCGGSCRQEAACTTGTVVVTDDCTAASRICCCP